MSVSDPPTAAEQLVRSDKFMASLYTGLVASCLFTLYYFFSAVTIFRGVRSSLWRSSDENGTARIKLACTQKISKMIASAKEMHLDTFAEDEATLETGIFSTSKKLDVKTQSDPVFQTYVLYGGGQETCASWSWVLKKLISKDLFKGGVWLPLRLWVFQVVPVVVLIIFAIAIRILVEILIQRAEEATAELQYGLPSWIHDMVPSGENVRIACLPSAVIAVGVMVTIVFLYIPSSVSTILKYRCGVYKSLGSNDFQVFRSAVDTTHMNTANAVYDFRKELLVHEAHRHPYIERISAIYLMRLRHKDFGYDANALCFDSYAVADEVSGVGPGNTNNLERSIRIQKSVGFFNLFDKANL